jgi:excisionase family DNA binding protein
MHRHPSSTPGAAEALPPDLPPTDGRRLAPIPSAQRMLGVGRSTIYALLARGDLVAVKLGARTLITVESIESLLRRLPRAVYRPPVNEGPTRTSRHTGREG